MPANQMKAGMPMLTLDAGCTVTLEAIDPLTGANVTGVTVSAVAIYGVNQTPGAKLDAPPVLLAYSPEG